MTSDISFTLKFIHKYDQPLLEYSTPNGTLSNRLLSPIIENSAEILSVTRSDSTQKSPNIVLTNDNSTNDGLTQTLLQKFHQYTINFHNIQTYLNTLDQHFQALSFIIQHLRNDQNFINIIEFFETRLLQMRVKRNQINRLLNQSSIHNILEKITPFVRKSKSIIDFNEFITSIQLSMNQKNILIDHLTNNYRYRKYQINEYSSKFHQQQDLLMKLIKQIEQYLAQHEKLIQQVNHTSIFNEHNRQCTELINLSNEYEQLQNENQFLILKAKENFQRFSMVMQSNHYH